MAYLETTVMVRWNPRNKNYFQSFGYQFTRMGDLFSVKTQDLQRYSAIKIHAICDSCRNIQPLPFDFYLFDYNLAIEYDGEQHFWAVYGEQQFQKTKTNDRIKTDYCNKKAIKLIRIPYYQIGRIEQILIQALNL